jgi:hypothetical protein
MGSSAETTESTGTTHKETSAMRNLITKVSVWLSARRNENADPSVIKHGILVGAVAAVVLPGAIALGIEVDKLFTIAW